MPKLKLTVQDIPVERLNLSLRVSVVQQLREYREFYEDSLKGKVQLNYLIEEIIKACIAEDKDFTKYQKNNEGKPKVAAPREDDEEIIVPAVGENAGASTLNHTGFRPHA